MSTGIVIGVPLGLMIADLFGWQLTLWLITLLGVVALSGLWLFLGDIIASEPPSLRQRLAMLVDTKVTSVISITSLVAIASLGLYTYLPPMLEHYAHVKSVTPYMWVWGIGGIVGSFCIGSLIDRTGKPLHLMLVILLILMLAMLLLFFSLQQTWFVFVLVFCWGAAGWASQAPQQHVLIKLETTE